MFLQLGKYTIKVFNSKINTELRPQTHFFFCRLENVKRLNQTSNNIESFLFSVYFSAKVDTQEISMDQYNNSYLKNMKPKPCFAAVHFCILILNFSSVSSEYPRKGINLLHWSRNIHIIMKWAGISSWHNAIADKKALFQESGTTGLISSGGFEIWHFWFSSRSTVNKSRPN